MFNFSFKTCGKTSSPLANTGTCRVCPTFYNNNPIYRAPIRPWLQRRWRQVSRGCYSKVLWKKYVLSLDLNTDSESTLIVSGNEFQTVGAEQRKACLAKSVLANGLSSSGTADDRSVRSLTRALMSIHHLFSEIIHHNI